ncbi:hypothetical protein FGG78_28125 [Thioclava sp. BHET1]|nr:hypothetical protein FGG78_28125 [Thioclava sp. BHET1]
MKRLKLKSVAVFSRPFTVPRLDEVLPAGSYDIETELSALPNDLSPDSCKASVSVNLHSRNSHLGLSRTLTVSLVDPDTARAKDELTGKELTAFFLEEMLTDPMVQLVMQADGVSEMQIRKPYSCKCSPEGDLDFTTLVREVKTPQGNYSIQAAENEGMPPKPN